jgi:hypothetical protein
VNGLGAHRRNRLVVAGRWVKVAHGVYDTDPTPPARRTGPDAIDRRRLRRVWAALLAHGPDAVAVGASALALMGVQGLPVDLVPEITLPGARFGRTASGLVVRQYEAGSRLRVVRGARTVEPELALAQAVPRLGRKRAVAIMDSALYRSLVTKGGLKRAHDLARGRRGVARTHEWWDLAVTKSESALETWARLDAIDTGRPPDKLQVRLVDDGRFLGRGDLGWMLPDGRWFIVEVDGAGVHGTLHALFHDRARQNAMLILGSAVVMRVTAEDLAVNGRFADELDLALTRLGRRR